MNRIEECVALYEATGNEEYYNEFCDLVVEAYINEKSNYDRLNKMQMNKNSKTKGLDAQTPGAQLKGERNYTIDPKTNDEIRKGEYRKDVSEFLSNKANKARKEDRDKYKEVAASKSGTKVKTNDRKAGRFLRYQENSRSKND